MIDVILNFEQSLSILKLRVPKLSAIKKLLEISKTQFEMEFCQLIFEDGKKFIDDLTSESTKIASLNKSRNFYHFTVIDLHPRERDVKKPLVQKFSPDSPKIPEKYKCPINKTIHTHRSITFQPCTHSIEKSRWKSWKAICDKKGKLTCPVCSMDIIQFETIPLELQTEIAQYVKKNLTEPFASDYWKDFQLYLHVVTLQKAYAKKKKEALPIVISSPFDKNLDGRFASDACSWFVLLGETKAKLLDLLITVNLNLYIKEHPDCLIVQHDDAIYDLEKLKILKGNQFHHLIPFYANEELLEIEFGKKCKHTLWIGCSILGAKRMGIRKLKVDDVIHDIEGYSGDPTELEHRFLKEIESHGNKKDTSMFLKHDIHRKRHKWQYEFVNGKFQDFNRGDSFGLEKAFTEGNQSYSFNIKGTVYLVDFILMTQKNLSTSRVRKVQRVGF